MFWLIIGGIIVFSFAAMVVLFIRAERYCICRCTHGRCGREIDGDDMLCQGCREVRRVGLADCHIPVIVMRKSEGGDYVLPHP